MQVGKMLSIAIVSVLLAACSSSSGSGNGIRLNDPASRGSFPTDVRTGKIIDLVEREDDGDVNSYTINGQTTGKYDFSDLGNGLTDNVPVSKTKQNARGQTTESYSGTMLVYQQPYSVVIGITYTQGSGTEFEADDLNVFEAGKLGVATPTSALQQLITENATFNYTGVAFDGQQEGVLNYTMRFGQRQGQGSITGFTRTGKIDLAPARLQRDDNRWIVEGQAILENDRTNRNVEYELSFYGPNAEEIAGKIEDDGDRRKGILGDNEIIFAGKRE